MALVEMKLPIASRLRAESRSSKILSNSLKSSYVESVEWRLSRCVVSSVSAVRVSDSFLFSLVESWWLDTILFID